ncbi:unnamed protein product, partial [Rotaria sordida]
MATADDYNNMVKSNLRFFDIVDESQEMLLPIKGHEKMPLVSLEEAVDPLCHLLPNIQQKVSLAKRQCQRPSDGLSSDESASIFLYTMEWEPQHECFYFILNRTLNDRDREKLKPWFLYLRLFLNALARLPSIHLIVYRGVKLDLTKTYPNRKKIVWWGFSSCTSSIKVLESKSFLGNEGTRTLFVIDCHTGKNIENHSSNHRNNEFLLLAGTQFEVIECSNQGNGLHHIELKEIDQSFPLLQPVLPLNLLSINNLNATSLDRYQNRRLEELIRHYRLHSKVYLVGQQLTDQDMSIVVKEAIAEKKCSKLDLVHNYIGSEGASILASALFDNKTLRKLKLSHNHVSDRGVQSLAEPLAFNNFTLQKLILTRNDITDRGARDLATMLKSNTTLTHLHLDYNQISDNGVQLLADALAHHNVTLQVLLLNGNKHVTDSSVDYFIDMLEHNQSLRELNVYDCNLSKIGKSFLRRAIK